MTNTAITLETDDVVVEVSIDAPGRNARQIVTLASVTAHTALASAVGYPDHRPPPDADAADQLHPDETLVKGLRVIVSAGCESFTTGVGSCFAAGRIVGATYGEDQACPPCIADRVLKGAPLPVARAVADHPTAGVDRG